MRFFDGLTVLLTHEISFSLVIVIESDASNFQAPYLVSLSLSVLGGLFYAIAPAFANK